MSVATGDRPVDTITVAGSELENAGTAIQWAAEQITPALLAAHAATARRVADDLEHAAVIIARQEGQTWAEVAAALGVTRQSAHAKYAHRLPRTLA